MLTREHPGRLAPHRESAAPGRWLRHRYTLAIPLLLVLEPAAAAERWAHEGSLARSIRGWVRRT